MASTRTTLGIVIALVVGATLALLIYSISQQTRVTCEVCVTFHGRTQCRTAAGVDRDQATRGAIDNACGLLTSGMSNSISCSNTPPDSVACSD